MTITKEQIEYVNNELEKIKNASIEFPLTSNKKPVAKIEIIKLFEDTDYEAMEPMLKEIGERDNFLKSSVRGGFLYIFYF